MWISETHGFVYLDVPRTGSSSMGQMLEKHYGVRCQGRHRFANAVRIHAYKFTFATCRDPFTRALSAWRFLFFRHDADPAFWTRRAGSSRFDDLMAWLGDHGPVDLDDDRGRGGVLAPQAAYLEIAGGMPDMVLRLEEIDAAIRRLPFWRPGVTVPKVNTSGVCPSSFLDMSLDSEQIVLDVYQDDFEMFGYARKRDVSCQE